MDFQGFLHYKLIQVSGYELNVFNLLQVLFCYIGTHLFLAFVLSWFKRLVKRRNYDSGRAHSLSLLLSYVIWVSSILLMLSFVGMKASVLVASSAALFVGLGLGLQSIFKDFVSGVFILFEGTIEVGDVLEVDKTIGRVDQLHLRTTKVITRDGVVVIIPNSKVVSDSVVNWSHNDSATRFRIPVRTRYGTDVEVVKTQLLKVAENAEEISDAEVRIADFGEKFVLYELVFWSHGSINIEDTKSDLRLAILHSFKAAGIEMEIS
jgi:small-conductance mechanosensitive channel